MIGRFTLLISALLLIGFTAPRGEAASDSTDAMNQGRALASEVLRQTPSENFTNAGVIKLRAEKRSEIPVKFEVSVSRSNWVNSYTATSGRNRFALTVVHTEGKPNEYHLVETMGEMELKRTLAGNQTMTGFARSDFWVADLGLEFLHWPEQKLLKSELRKSRLCRVLESTNPEPATNAYARVVSWIDDESLGLLHAEAYDFKNKLLKEFDTKKFRKVNGVWQLEEMEISNVETDSRTLIQFNLNSE